jgi:hypothetical protein
LTTDLAGFAHEDLALMSAIVKKAGDRHADVVTSMEPLHWALDPGLVDRAAVILALADEIEARCPHDRNITVECEIDRRVILTVRALPSWLVKDLDNRFERAFGRTLIVRHR